MPMLANLAKRLNIFLRKLAAHHQGQRPVGAGYLVGLSMRIEQLSNRCMPSKCGSDSLGLPTFFISREDIECYNSPPGKHRQKPLCDGVGRPSTRVQEFTIESNERSIAGAAGPNARSFFTNKVQHVTAAQSRKKIGWNTATLS
jgi:hypothetical protein